MLLIKASYEQKQIINNLMQFYMYDFSEFVDLDVKADGFFAAYKNLDDYWNDENRFPYIIQNEEKPIGFALVRLIESAQRSHYSIAEFFVMKKYRKKGIGKQTAIQLFNLHKGLWEVFQRESNKPAQLFWNNVIGAYTKGNFTERFEDGKTIQNFISI
jgi:predicted acetyltransferase